jgi:hypothetical protein
MQDGSSGKHTSESYFKDIDNTEPVNPKVHQVDSSGAPIARGNEQPTTGQFSRSGPDSTEYETVCWSLMFRSSVSIHAVNADKPTQPAI